jgi:pilus assembly protein CpaB
MKPKTLVLMGVAIACGLGASYMTSRLLAERQTDDEPRLEVLVAKKNLNIGETIKVPEELFQYKKFARGDEPVNAVTSFDELKNRVLKRPLRPGDHVTPDDMLSDRDAGGEIMSIVLPPGHRAVGVKVNLESGAFGFACLPLSRVDVISTVRRSDDKATYSQVLLQNVLVLAADDRMKRGEDGKAMPSQVVTLALKPEDMLKVRLAGELGPLSLALRKINDTSYADVEKINATQLKMGERGQNVGDDPVEEKKDPPVIAEAPKADTKVEGSAQVTPQAKPAPTDEVKQVARKFTMTITEGGRTRRVDYFLNEQGEVIDSQPATGSGEPHPPRPTDAAEEQTKK